METQRYQNLSLFLYAFYFAFFLLQKPKKKLILRVKKNTLQ